eukprot:CAMPEP_0179472832 /NCGR_PEP_ID=MMETSP0799-20121207/52742_1 /TAXON_ID=46947 /ORGANISM="Geminigera cryophila, Strain CCMP2564" /LENGTH=91 /DNA_ID=CAMNT_0021281197 /DNA_START=341 /DNA_END=613 /DNA_ORIENTATION=-
MPRLQVLDGWHFPAGISRKTAAAAGHKWAVSCLPCKLYISVLFAASAVLPPHAQFLVTLGRGRARCSPAHDPSALRPLPPAPHHHRHTRSA